MGGDGVETPVNEYPELTLIEPGGDVIVIAERLPSRLKGAGDHRLGIGVSIGCARRGSGLSKDLVREESAGCGEEARFGEEGAAGERHSERARHAEKLFQVRITRLIEARTIATGCFGFVSSRSGIFAADAKTYFFGLLAMIWSLILL